MRCWKKEIMMKETINQARKIVNLVKIFYPKRTQKLRSFMKEGKSNNKNKKLFRIYQARRNSCRIVRSVINRNSTRTWVSKVIINKNHLNKKLVHHLRKRIKEQDHTQMMGEEEWMMIDLILEWETSSI